MKDSIANSQRLSFKPQVRDHFDVSIRAITGVAVRRNLGGHAAPQLDQHAPFRRMDGSRDERITDEDHVDQPSIPFHCRPVKPMAIETSALLDRLSAMEREWVGESRKT